mmetsp:Transcript_11422/g.25072  ORF Transcript_11422/g.25072 Transcript_11422/m.25072 type:complete len:90 (-) Transcript_11422:963-1232(-)
MLHTNATFALSYSFLLPYDLPFMHLPTTHYSPMVLAVLSQVLLSMHIPHGSSSHPFCLASNTGNSLAIYAIRSFPAGLTLARDHNDESR